MTWIKSTCPYCTSTDDHTCLGFCFDTKIADMECTDCDQEYIADFQMVVSNERRASANIQIQKDQATAACPYCQHVVNILIDDDSSDFAAYTACQNSECRGIFKMIYRSPSIVVDEKEFIKAGGSLAESFSVPILRRKAPDEIGLSNVSFVSSNKEFHISISDPESEIERVQVLFCDDVTGEWGPFKTQFEEKQRNQSLSDSIGDSSGVVMLLDSETGEWRELDTSKTWKDALSNDNDLPALLDELVDGPESQDLQKFTIWNPEELEACGVLRAGSCKKLSELGFEISFPLLTFCDPKTGKWGPLKSNVHLRKNPIKEFLDDTGFSSEKIKKCLQQGEPDNAQD